MYSSITPRRSRASAGVSVRTFIPARTGVVHDAGKPRWPWTSTRPKRHEPNGSSESVAHNFGTWIPASAAARITDVPSGTATPRPSISSATVLAPGRSGVAKSLSIRDRMVAASSCYRDRQVVADEFNVALGKTEIFTQILYPPQHNQRITPPPPTHLAAFH